MQETLIQPKRLELVPQIGLNFQYKFTQNNFLFRQAIVTWGQFRYLYGF